MADFRMPSLGADMDAGTLVEWKVKPGQAVHRGEVVAVVETEKGAIDLEVWQDGVVEALVVPVGCRVPVGSVLARLRGAGEPVAPTPIPAPTPVAPGPAPVQAVRAPRSSPAARKAAEALGVRLEDVPGTGPGGAVTREDVTAFAAARTSAPAKAPAPPAEDKRAAMRHAIAASMARSKREVPHYYVGEQLDLGRALAWLEAQNASRPVAERLLPVALWARAVARAAREVPEVNGYFTDGAFRPSERVHLGLAIALRGGGGLVAPALHDADQLPLPELMRAIDDLVSRTRRGGLRSSELSDATLTFTSLGDLGAAEVYGVIFPPQVAIVGLGRPTPRPWVVEGRVVARPVATLTLSGDHRVSDGLQGSRYLAAVARLLLQPEQP